MLLPKIRSQDQNIVPTMMPYSQPEPSSRPTKRARTSPPPSMKSAYRPGHSRSMTNPETISYNANPVHYSPPMTQQECSPTSLMGSPVIFPSQTFAVQTTSSAVDNRSQRAQSCNLDDNSVDKFGFPTYREMPTYVVSSGPVNAAGSSSPKQDSAPAMLPVSSQQDLASLPAPSSYFQPYAPQSYEPRAVSPPMNAAPAVAPEVQLQPSVLPTAANDTTMLNYLTSSNPAPSLVRNISFPLRDPHTKHFWWDVRQIRPWTSFNTATLMSLQEDTAASLLTCPVPSSYLPIPMGSQRHPETETSLAAIYASHYLPKLNAALALSANRPLQLSVPFKTGPHATKDSEQMFVATNAHDASSAAAIFGGKPSARVVGLVKSFDRFNTGMRVEGNVKKVEYLRGLAHLHHVMREHGCRYGFILTEIELVIVRNGLEGTPHFGFMEVTSCQLATTANPVPVGEDMTAEGTPMTACLALWGLCMLASDEPLPQGHAMWRAEIGAPAEGTRRKALPRDSWMPQPQLAEKREAKRSRGWVMPEDPVGRKELGKRGVRYGAC